jgi:hypothetical protein
VRGLLQRRHGSTLREAARQPEAFEAPEHEFVEVAGEGDVPETRLAGATLERVDVVLARVEGRICAIAATCTRLGGPLAE